MSLRPQEYDFKAGIHSLYEAINQRIMHQTNGCKRKMSDVVFPYWALRIMGSQVPSGLEIPEPFEKQIQTPRLEGPMILRGRDLIATW